MKLRITYDPETKRVINFACVPQHKATMDTLEANQIFIHGAEVPMQFYREYHRFSLTPDRKLRWEGNTFAQITPANMSKISE